MTLLGFSTSQVDEPLNGSFICPNLAKVSSTLDVSEKKRHLN